MATMPLFQYGVRVEPQFLQEAARLLEELQDESESEQEQF